jgi:hypothetical protein
MNSVAEELNRPLVIRTFSSMPQGTAFNFYSGPIRGYSRMDPLFLRPPCGIQADLEQKVTPPSASEYLRDGATPDVLREAGFTARELAMSGVSAQVLRQAGYPTLQIANSRRYGADDLRAAGVPLIECLGAGVSIPELVRSGYSELEWAAAGVSPAAIKKLGLQDARAPRVAAPRRPGSAGRPPQADHSQRPRTAPAARTRG